MAAPAATSVDDEVRKSVVRIAFVGKFGPGRTKPMVLSGLIILVNDGSCEIAVESTLLKNCASRDLTLNFPNNDPNNSFYGLEIQVSFSSVRTGPFISKIVVEQNTDAYDRKIVMQTKMEVMQVMETEDLDIFVFPREDFLTPYGYWPASVINSIPEVFCHDGGFHEYGHYGSPAFNKEGHCVGLCFMLQGRTSAWSIHSLREILTELFSPDEMERMSFVRGGVPISYSE